MTLPAPYYADEAVTLYHGDCRELLPMIESASVTLTDPPYNCGKNYGETTDDKRPWPEWCEWWDGILGELRRITPTAVFAFLSQTAHRKYVRLGKYEPDWTAIWNKPLAMAACHAAFLPHWEAIDFWGDGRKANGYFAGSDVITHNVVRKEANHPTPKPVEMIRECVRRFVPASGLVLDPFAGSGTTLLAARLEGRRAIGIEVNPTFCEEIASRLRPAPTTPHVRTKSLALFSEGS